MNFGIMGLLDTERPHNGNGTLPKRICAVSVLLNSSDGNGVFLSAERL